MLNVGSSVTEYSSCMYCVVPTSILWCWLLVAGRATSKQGGVRWSLVSSVKDFYIQNVRLRVEAN